MSGRSKLLKIKRQSGSKLVGVILHKTTHEYLALYCLSEEVSKSHVIRNVMEDWEKNLRKIAPEEMLIEAIVENVKFQMEHSSTTQEEFKLELMDRGLSPSQIRTILKAIYGTNKATTIE